MSVEIWKYELEVAGLQGIRMPKGAQLLHVATQRGAPCIWAKVDSKNPPVNRQLIIYGTGHPITADEGVYVGTFLVHDDSLVFHVFDLGEVKS